MNLDFVTLEDGINYLIFEQIDYNNIKYLYLVNENDKDDFCIRKVIIEDEKQYLTAIADENELNMAIKLFAKKQ